MEELMHKIGKRYGAFCKNINAWVCKACFVCAVFCAAFGWWGVLYPELTMTQDTYRILSEDGSVEETANLREKEDMIYIEILNAGSGKVRFRSRLITELSEWISAIRQ